MVWDVAAGRVLMDRSTFLGEGGGWAGGRCEVSACGEGEQMLRFGGSRGPEGSRGRGAGYKRRCGEGTESNMQVGDEAVCGSGIVGAVSIISIGCWFLKRG